MCANSQKQTKAKQTNKQANIKKHGSNMHAQKKIKYILVCTCTDVCEKIRALFI